MKIGTICLRIIIFLLLPSCHPGKTATLKANRMNRTILFTPSPQTLVYKTSKDYSRNIPVLMNRERTRIVSYPAPTDIYYRGVLSMPTPLHDGYLLDNRGISANVAFLDYTYQAYAQLGNAPSTDELIKHIIDKHPLTALWDCGIRTQYKNEVEELNRLVDTGFAGCKKIAISSTLLQKDPYN